MAYTWHAVDLLSGKRGPELKVKTLGTVNRIIGEATDAQLSVACWNNGSPVPEWRTWTQPGRIMLVLVDDDDRPLWGGVVLRRIADSSQWVQVDLATLEHYLDRRYAGTMTFSAVAQETIAAALVQASISTQGIPFIIRTQATGVVRDRTYADSDDKTLLSVLTDLLNIDQGIEFTVDVEWSDATHTVLNRVISFGSRIGVATANPTRFEHPGPVTSFTVTEDYTKDNGANDVMAVSSGEGGTRPQSTHHVDDPSLAAGWARYEERFTPSTSISLVSTLESYAVAELAILKAGLTSIALVVDLTTGPRINADWWLGDDITAAITAPAYPPRVGANYQVLAGYERRVRVVGWSIDVDARTMTPTLREYS